MIKSHTPSVVAVAEPFVGEHGMSRLQQCMDFGGGISNEGDGGKLWVMWKTNESIVVSCTTGQSITILAKEKDKQVAITFVYAKCSYLDRRKLWEDLSSMRTGNTHWIVMRDFNIIHNDGERIGGRPRLNIAMGEFKDFIDAVGLVEANYEGNMMSWCNGQQGRVRSWARLDRTLVNGSFLLDFPRVLLSYLLRQSSDHSPLIVSLEQRNKSYGFIPFKFQ
ncbi:uncharacterized protein LOC121247553 [Juglans microcarpa x Juglans regia]|uniref:uncharacterized protein LOC121247553 n=1 Tax=Juglans microcarpa x Juglans regia TaxID=2249226 RepID=UPI001B7E7D26|nr:uncharacterized protein LOC121247553 [Juglans microcarpa x Juglans regia]